MVFKRLFRELNIQTVTPNLQIAHTYSAFTSHSRPLYFASKSIFFTLNKKSAVKYVHI